MNSKLVNTLSSLVLASVLPFQAHASGLNTEGEGENNNQQVVSVGLNEDVCFEIISYVTPHDRTSLKRVNQAFYIAYNRYKEFAINHCNNSFENLDLDIPGIPLSFQWSNGDFWVKTPKSLKCIRGTEVFSSNTDVKFSCSYQDGLLINSENQLKKISVLNDFGLVEEEIFPGVDARQFGEMIECKNGSILVSDISTGLLLLNSKNQDMRVLQEGAFDPVQKFIPLGNSCYLTQQYDDYVIDRDGVVSVNTETAVLMIGECPNDLPWEHLKRAGNGLDQFAFCSTSHQTGENVYHLGSIGEDESIQVGPLGFNPLPESYRFMNFFMSDECLVTLGSKPEVKVGKCITHGWIYSSEGDGFANILTVHDTISGQKIYELEFLDDVPSLHMGSALVGKKIRALFMDRDGVEKSLVTIDLSKIL